MLLFYLVFIPFLTGIICWCSECINKVLPRWFALIGIGVTFIITLALCVQSGKYMLDVVQCSVSSHWQKEYVWSWVSRFDINFRLALDGLSLLMVMLSGFLGVLSVLCSWKEVRRQVGFFYFNLLWLISCVIAVFLSIDMFCFFLFWEMMIFPMYLLISLWGHKFSNVEIRIQAAVKFFIYSQISGLVMLVAILGLVFVNYNVNGVWTFNYDNLLFVSMPIHIEYLLMLGFFVAFAVKLPIIPFHGWLSDAHSESPTAGSVDLSGILLKIAAYGLFRFNLPLFPNASRGFSFIGIFLGVISIFYFAWISFSQTDIKRLIAYSSMSHMGFILLAVYSGDLLAYQGAVIHIVAHSLSTAGMFILCGQLFERIHIRDMRIMGGLWDKLHLIPGLSLLFSICMLGLPGTGNFIGEVMILFGLFHTYPVIASISAFGSIFASVYSLIFIHRIYYGISKINNNYSSLSFSLLSFREQVIIFPLLFFVICLGFFPQPVIDISFISMNNIYKCFKNVVRFPVP
ncbi:NADH-quinone oxidoreductase subunit M [Blochmannia endosymbiont of Polyrhachis (Hedomyrma) turneri]|uniref:NADH-quinone oxidoreductase subunit M n=1 Tax=Blochmannia endosymbiont of Polyrhachis (Hedomyrma) turneri TaxID=1505596 RepID=UPI00061A7A18|nr:NADH-quinone oxidoreductase subunit M [Blochmannia endosymbiont of Polyrhachis (Hedomyrma) turneri]AKC60044.1 NADH-quinone oxidoreductase subunit M [Blochmannia endosymbiont of Polyrhachis (Hedomyrma) turneri]